MKVYLAGPDVFLPDAAAMAAEKKRLCARHGLEGVFPTDPRPDPAADAQADLWYAIYLRNEAHIRACDALVANLTPFRGPSADAGTVYELGFMRALGRPVAGYSNDALGFSDRTRRFLGQGLARRGERDVDAEGLALEDFGLADNLMIDGGIRAAGGLLVRKPVAPARRWQDLEGFEACLKALAAG
ncbi:nucleoside 2-deoxyribosyltransferase [Falsiroseomonas selenitidurans]|uniref:Nucleoside 2-deoxyribosyltransferase n=1 Tax=Falsiroseomonas selenitidurans TaxID=2716335 RepID=A0ABX1E1K1_9PROT|nr:nucleoside 2-deoxyribosyltransferase [Falsiroseomonas selenitidurans]NKC30570.1 nucleoside 2-deoxyribosyltransferase [Falsiroseomonas selenitidurans]